MYDNGFNAGLLLCFFIMLGIFIIAGTVELIVKGVRNGR